jgi:polysaccharide export outer membrane protein
MMKQIFCVTTLFLVTAGLVYSRPSILGGEALGVLQDTSNSQVSDSFVIGLEDVLSINVWKEPELSAAEVVVRPDGMITLPLIGDVEASGITTGKLQEAIAGRLKKYVATPTVTVTVVRIESHKVSIVGQVAKPGSYPMIAPMTVLELIARAGGLTEFAKTKDIKIVRKKDGKTLSFNYKDVIKGKNLSQNVILEVGDIVLVP